MTDKVKNHAVEGSPYRRGVGQTRISAKHQVTIPMDAFTDAGFKPGDTVRAEAIGPGRVVLTRTTALLDEFSGALRTNGALRNAVEQVRDEWV
jgi:bifunctional DNA-binding transcriptional regulator/antitoxin component of YhaV-PrlF toxin-antitoxin module